MLVLISSPPRVLPDNPENSSSHGILLGRARGTHDSETIRLSLQLEYQLREAANFCLIPSQATTVDYSSIYLSGE